MRNFLVSVVTCCFLIGCVASPVDLIAESNKRNFIVREIRTDSFSHYVIEQRDLAARQVVFIEGDGRPWTESGTEPSSDPTPGHALAFELMTRTPGHSFYISRPCYFGLLTDSCGPDVWTSHRFSGKVIASMGDALKQVLDPAFPVTLVGYSGGAAIAHLLARELQFVDSVVSIAGVYDIHAWTDHHRFESLGGSLNPADYKQRGDVLYLFLHGARDVNVTTSNFAPMDNGTSNVIVEIYDDYSHVCCWTANWEEIWRDQVATILPTRRNDPQ